MVKSTIHSVLFTGTTIVKKIWLSLCLIRCVRFARYCGKMYSRHLFSYGGFHKGKSLGNEVVLWFWFYYGSGDFGLAE